MEKSNTQFNTDEFRKHGKDMVNMISDLYDDLENHPVYPKVQPGFLRNQFPVEAPLEGIPMEEILEETKSKIFPGNFTFYYLRYHPLVTSCIFCLLPFDCQTSICDRRHVCQYNHKK